MDDAWNAEHYDDKLGYVSRLGQEVVTLLRPQRGENILDLGCGTGDLTNEIASFGATVVGIDRSPSMIHQARRKYPELQFIVADGEDFRLPDTFDAVFSNAALHWMKRPTHVIQSIRAVLRPRGRFVAEFGGKGNVNTLIQALERALTEQGIDARDRNPWYFPSIAEYAALLEAHGFWPTFAAHFDRPTEMPGSDKGLVHWLDGFASSYLKGLDGTTRMRVIERVVEFARPSLYDGRHWVMDYKRLRVQALKL